MITLSIIIPSFNTKDLTFRCLHSIFKYSPSFDFEIIVVDNDSKDQTAKVIKEKFPQVKLIANKKNLGYSKANNQGLSISQGEYILLLNSDVYIQKNAIAILIDYLKTHPRVGAASAKLINPDGSVQYYYHRRFPTFLFFAASFIEHYFKIQNPLSKSYFMLDEKFNRTIEIDQAAGTVLAFKKAIVKKIGGLFDEKLPLYFNDTDLCQRLKQNDLKVVVVPKAQVIHYRESSTKQLDPNMILEELFLSMIYYFHKHRQYISYILAKITLSLLLGLTIFATSTGLIKSYFKIPITNKKLSLINQKKMLTQIIWEKRIVH